MKKFTLFIIISLSLITNACAGTIDFFFEYGVGSEVNNINLNGNFRNIINEFNGGIDNTNLKTGFRLVEVLGALPIPETPGRVVYLTTEDVLYLDDGSAWFGTPTYTGTPAQGEMLYFNGTNWVRLGVGTVGNTLKSGGAAVNLSWAALNLAGGSGYITGTLPIANGGTGATSGTLIYEGDTAGGSLTGTYPDPGIKASNVIFAWSGNDSYAANDYGMNISTTREIDVGTSDTAGYVNFANDTTTYRTFLNFRFLKTAGINTVTIEARIWSSSSLAAREAFLSVDIGGQNNTVKSIESSTPTWVTTSDINVSGLSDGTTYDGIVQLKAELADVDVYCSAITLIGK